ncbi:MAG: HAMP domain-containing protein [bacterium]|nr:HAMP domain-containing protein [bacterium]
MSAKDIFAAIKDFFVKIGLVFYHAVEKIPVLNKLTRAGGIKFKWAIVISSVILIIVLLFSLIFTMMSINALLESNDKLCRTIASNISATEEILTGEKTYKRSIILQDFIKRLSKSKIDGLEYVSIYDVKGFTFKKKKSDKKVLYAAHIDTRSKYNKQGKRVSKAIVKEIKLVEKFEKKEVVLRRKDPKNKKDKKATVKIPCFQYRMPFKFFAGTKDEAIVGVIEVAFTKESILGPVETIKTYIMILGIIMLLIGIAISLFTATSMVQPILTLSNGMKSVRDGDLSIELNILRHDELGDLSEEYNNMITHLREKLQMQKFVSGSTVSMIKEKSKSGDIGLGGSRENLAFLFSDIRGFTAMSENMEPEEVVSILNEYLDLQAQIIIKNNGDIDKFVGDEVMAVFSDENRADDALSCAVEIIEAIDRLNEERTKQDLHTVDVGVGLNIGDVVHGRMGARDRMDNTSIGDAVNLAARLCSQAEKGAILASKIIMSEATKGKFKGKKLDSIRVKGKARPIPIFSVTGKKE